MKNFLELALSSDGNGIKGIMETQFDKVQQRIAKKQTTCLQGSSDNSNDSVNFLMQRICMVTRWIVRRTYHW